MHLANRSEGIALCPEAAACLDVLDGLVRQGHILPDETVVVFNTGAAQKNVEAIETELPTLATPVDYSLI
jgi:threonine synthase